MTASLLNIAPARQVPARAGGEIATVAEGSPAWRAGIRTGDWLVAVNGLVIRDVIDYSYETAAPELVLVVDRNGQRFQMLVEKEPDDELGIQFALPVFEGIRECNNNCDFCFIRGLPKGLRTSLYIRDDDYRYSYLFGTFLTLTNLEERDWRRIGYQRLSPLHVSVHATDLGVRRQMLQNPRAPDILSQLDRLETLGIEVKAQIVLCPGVNDGKVLERSVRDLGERAGVVDSMAVVPVGLTRYSRVRGLRTLTSEEARAVIRQAAAWQRNFRLRLGRDFAYLSDELYLMAGAPFPPAWRYDGYRQLQNGVGLTRLLLDDWKRNGQKRLPDRVSPGRQVAWLCGRAAWPALRKMADDARTVKGLDLQVVEVRNEFFGDGITVSGLLAGADIARCLQELEVDVAVLPRSAFGFQAEQTLDGWTPRAIERESGRRLRLASSATDLLDATLAG